MPIGAEIDLDLRGLDRGFRAMAKATRNFRPVWNRLAPTMKLDQLEHWRLQLGLESTWAPRASSTRRRHGKRRKIFSKRFAKGFSIVKTSHELASVSKIPYADVHQFGGTAGHGAKIPARPFLYLSDKFQAIALPAMKAHMLRAWSRA